uniref:Uncharacterized protein n=1 Tax=Medicago truncatula TaxID=3880 RepID=I3T3M0_MEDTR|nr:unknown [Medicago truncatula]
MKIANPRCVCGRRIWSQPAHCVCSKLSPNPTKSSRNAGEGQSSCISKCKCCNHGLDTKIYAAIEIIKQKHLRKWHKMQEWLRKLIALQIHILYQKSLGEIMRLLILLLLHAI